MGWDVPPCSTAQDLLQGKLRKAGEAAHDPGAPLMCLGQLLHWSQRSLCMALRWGESTQGQCLSEEALGKQERVYPHQLGLARLWCRCGGYRALSSAC